MFTCFCCALIRGCALWSKRIVLGVVHGLCADFPQVSPSGRSRILIDAHYSVSLHTNPFKFYLHGLRPHAAGLQFHSGIDARRH